MKVNSRQTFVFRHFKKKYPALENQIWREVLNPHGGIYSLLLNLKIWFKINIQLLYRIWQTKFTRNKYCSGFSLLVSIILLLNSIFYIRHNPLIEVYERKLDFVHTWCRRKESKLYNRRVIWLLLPQRIRRIQLENNDIQGLHF